MIIMDIETFRKLRKLSFDEALIEFGKFYLPNFKYKHLDAEGISDQLRPLFRYVHSDKKEKRAFEEINTKMARFLE
jgi:hypothetical protein